MGRVMRASTHDFAKALLERDEAPIRGMFIGKWFITWDGKTGDFTPTLTKAEMDHLFGTSEGDNNGRG